MRRIGPAVTSALVLGGMGLGLLLVLYRYGGPFLVVDNPQKSDAILVTQTDSFDRQYWMGVHLLAGGYAGEMLLDARTDRIFFGQNQAEWAGDFIRKTAARVPGRVGVCPITADTTAEEVYQASDCLKGRSIRSVLLVVDDFHSRRSLAIFSHLLPQYHWSIAPVTDAQRFGTEWWRKRSWIRTTVIEWQHLLWWELLDRFRFKPIRRALLSGPPEK